MTNHKEKNAIIYCRVSSKKQSKDGQGLHSQEHRCRQYAAGKGYEVEAVFPDDVSGGGDFMNRPGMVRLLNYLDKQSGTDYVVVFDDLKRFARDTEFHIKLRRELKVRRADVECLNFRFEDTPEGKFIETVFAAHGELEREQNGRQVVQKMKARVEKGFWVFRAPVGYRYEKSPHGGKVLVPDEPLASIVREALEGFANGRFTSQTEVKRFLESFPTYPKDTPKDEIHPQTVVRLLGKAVYAGCVSAPEWGVSMREGQHEGLITLAEFERIQKRLKEGVYAPTRKDIKEDFPLRGAVSCGSCATPLTAGWSKGKCKKYAYYFCRKTGCEQYGKSIPRAKIEGDFKGLLLQLEPSQGLVRIAAGMFKEHWDHKLAQTGSLVQSFKQDVLELENKINELVDRIVEASNPRVISAYEKRLAELERQKLVVQEKVSNSGAPQRTFDEMFEHAMHYLSSPWKIWDSGRFDLQRLVLKLTFSGHLEYCRETGFRTPKTTLPFKVLGAFLGDEREMVPPG